MVGCHVCSSREGGRGEGERLVQFKLVSGLGGGGGEGG